MNTITHTDSFVVFFRNIFYVYTKSRPNYCLLKRLKANKSDSPKERLKENRSVCTKPNKNLLATSSTSVSPQRLSPKPWASPPAQQCGSCHATGHLALSRFFGYKENRIDACVSVRPFVRKYHWPIWPKLASQLAKIYLQHIIR